MKNIVENLKLYLKKYKNSLEQLGVKDIYIAGSYSKGVESQDSDIDLILKVDNEDLDWSIFGIFFDIENQLKVKIDIGFLDSLNKDIEGNVKNSLIKIF